MLAFEVKQITRLKQSSPSRLFPAALCIAIDHNRHGIPMQGDHSKTEHTIWWINLALMMFITGALGCWGFAEAYGYTGGVLRGGDSSVSLFDLIYYTLQLFVFEFPSGISAIPVQLEIARFLAPLLTLSSLAVFFLVMFDHIKMLQLRANPGHVVICGCGYLGLDLARHFRSEKKNRYVVIIEKDPAKKELDICKQLGVMVIIGDATQEHILKQARIHRASEIFFVTGSDKVNGEIAVTCSRLGDGHRNRRSARRWTDFRDLLGITPDKQVQRYHIHLEDPTLAKAFILAHPVNQDSRQSIQVEFFNLYRIAGYCMQKEHPPVYDFELKAGIVPHILVIGCGRMGESLIIQTVRGWKEKQYPGKIRITCIDINAEKRVRDIVSWHPSFNNYCTIEPVSMDIRSEEFAGGLFLDNGREHPFTRVYICLGESSFCVATALILTERLKLNDIPIIARSTYLDGTTQLMDTIQLEKDYSQISTFPIVSSNCCMAYITGGLREMLGRAMYVDYVRGRSRDGQHSGESPALKVWEELESEDRERYVDQADDIRRKLNTIGYDIAPMSHWDEPLFEFSPAEVECLARMEHERRMKNTLRSGSTKVLGRNTVQKTDPGMVRFNDLSPEARDEIRWVVKGIPRLLKHHNLGVVCSCSAYRDTLARVIHENYLKAEYAKGYTPQDNRSLVPWEDLDDELRKSNRQQAIDISRKLARIGCEIRFRSEKDSSLFTFTEGEIELLAEKEHDRWMIAKAGEGWTYGREKDPARKTHPSLVPYSDLTREDRDRDRLAVRNIPKLLAMVNLKVVRNPSIFREDLARAIHEAYVERRLLEGGVALDDSALKPWNRLTETLKEQNRYQAADIGNKVDLIGCEIRVLQSCKEPIRNFSEREVEFLAEREHERWVYQRLRDGWVYGDVKDAEKKQSPYLVPYEELSEEIKDRDREAVCNIPALLARAGLCVARKGE